MIRVLYRPPQGQFDDAYQVADLPELVRAEGGLLWLDFEAVPADVARPILTDIFRFHPLAVDDALEELHTPKIDDWGSYLYLVLRSARLDPAHDGQGLDSPELDIFLGHDFLITYHAEPLPAVNAAWRQCQRDERLLAARPARLLYGLVDEIAAETMQTLDQIDAAVDSLELQIFGRPSQQILAALFGIKRTMLTLRRHLGPQQDVLGKLARDDYTAIVAADRIFFRDVYDHYVRLVGLSDSLRDLVASATDSYLSVMNNRMNDIMKTLTIITTLFLPLTFITGFFGMNFFQAVAPLGSWTKEISFAITLMAIVLLPTVMFWWMRRHGWMQ